MPKLFNCSIIFWGIGLLLYYKHDGTIYLIVNKRRWLKYLDIIIIQFWMLGLPLDNCSKINRWKYEFDFNLKVWEPVLKLYMHS